MGGMMKRSTPFTRLLVAGLIAGAGCTQSPLSVDEFQQRHCMRPYPAAGSPLCAPPSGEVELIGTLGVQLACTKRMCPETEPCCNRCTGSPMLRASEPGSGITLQVQGVTCHTVKCDVFCGS